MSERKQKLTLRHYVVAIAGVAATTFCAAPLAVSIKLAGSLITAVLPIVITYFAALTTTALAAAAGDEQVTGRVMLYLFITALLGVVLTAWSTLEQYINELTRYKIEAIMSDRMYEHFLNLDFWQYDDKRTADLFDRAREFANFYGLVFDRLAALMTQLITMLAGLVAMVFVSWWLALVLLVAIVPSLVLQLRLSRKKTAHWNANVETRRMKGMIEWNMFDAKYIAELRLYGMVRHLLDLRLRLRTKDEKARIELERQTVPQRIIADVVEAAGEVAALVYTTLQIIAGAQPIGQFIYVQQVVSRALGGARTFVQQLAGIDEEIANLFDYQKFMKLPALQRGGHRLSAVPQVIAVQDVSFVYPQSKKTVLKGVSLTITRGQHIAIVGENGAGKSTLIKLLTGLYAPTKGSVLLDGTDLREYDISAWHKHIAVLGQQYLSFGYASARDNVYFGDVGKPFDEARFNAAIDRADARSFLEKLPKGFDNYVINWMEHNDGTRGVDLSGGQWQRLALARNFYRDSPIIILDEPTSAIDALAEERIFSHLFADKMRTVISISHRLSTIEKADVIYMLQEGRLIEQGTHAELVAAKGAYYTMFKSQLHA